MHSACIYKYPFEGNQGRSFSGLLTPLCSCLETKPVWHEQSNQTCSWTRGWNRSPNMTSLINPWRKLLTGGLPLVAKHEEVCAEAGSSPFMVGSGSSPIYVKGVSNRETPQPKSLHIYLFYLHTHPYLGQYSRTWNIVQGGQGRGSFVQQVLAWWASSCLAEECDLLSDIPTDWARQLLLNLPCCCFLSFLCVSCCVVC